MKTILLVSNSGTIIGGGEISLLQLIKYLDASRFRGQVLCPGKGSFFEAIEQLGITPIVSPMPGLRKLGWLKLPRSVKAIMSLMRRQQIDLVHANGPRCMLYAGLAGRLTGIPVIWHVRVMEKDVLFDCFLALLASKIVANSRAVAGRFPYLRGASEKVSVIHNGVDTRRFNPELSGESVRSEYAIEPAEKIVTLVGRMDEWKGHRFFLEAAAKVLSQLPRVRFLVVGDGVLRNELEELTPQLGIAKEVVFTGYREDVPEILAASDLVVSASLGESFGRVLIEAMAVAKPVIATRAGGVPEIVMDEQTGLLVPPGRPDEMAEAIARLLNDPKRSRAMGVAGLQRVKEQFSIEKHAGEIEKIYESYV